MAARVISTASQKGGVGKTTTTVNLACAFAGRGRRLLVLDLDPQFAATRAFGLAPSELQATTYELMAGDVALADAAVQVAEGVDLVGSKRELANLELSLVAELERERFLAEAIGGALRPYDLVLIDTPPSLGLLTVNALYASQEVIAPVAMTDPGALQGVGELRSIVTRLAGRRKAPRLRAAVRVLADPRRVTDRAIDAALAELAVPVAETSIPSRAAFSRSAIEGVPLVLAEPGSDGAQAFAALAAELDP